ncbi:MAG: serpin family protein [Clostridiales bacterium]|nr:serpin family protein [Clostridiales bacterium]
MRNTTTKITALLMASVIMMSGCQGRNNSRRSTREEKPSDPEMFNTTIDYEDLDRVSFNEQDFNSDYNSYSFRLMSQVLSGEDSDANVMVSPASIMFAMDLAAAGANGDTLTQITDLYAEGSDPQEQQAFAAAMMNRINASEDVVFNTANAIWTNDNRMSSGLNPDYQDYVEEYFDAQANQEAFSMDTVNEINSWIEENTNGMIDHVLDDLEPEAIAVLVNAIAFEGNWAEAYEDYQVQTMSFTTASGEDIDVDMLCDETSVYYESDKATGFIKYYEGGQYAFLTMLPSDESISANEFLSGFTAEDYNDFINSRTYEYQVYTRLPEFDYDYDTNLNRVLMSLGVTEAFDEDNADFTGIGFADDGGNIFIGRVLHNTHIELDRNGTRAAAATTIVMLDGTACLPDEEMIRYVYCDRPFAYAIVDTETMNPIFLGTYNG